MLWGCQPVADCKSSMVAPLGRARRVRQAFCFELRFDGPALGTGSVEVEERAGLGVHCSFTARFMFGFADCFDGFD